MFVPTRPRLIKSLNNLRLGLCRSGGEFADLGISEHYCDCKYGYGTDKEDPEKSGCPEVRTTIAILETLTENEFSLLCERAGLQICEEKLAGSGDGDPNECQKKKKT